MPIFYNRDIFSADRDYVIAGFETNEAEEVNFALIYNKMRERMMKLCQEFIDGSITINVKLNYENPLEESHQQAIDIVNDYLQVTPGSNDVNSIVQTIIDTPQMQTWMTQIKENITDYQSNLGTAATSLEIRNKTGEGAEQSFYDAFIYTTETSFEQLVEEIGSIQM